MRFNNKNLNIPYIPEEIVCPQPGGDDRLRFVALQDNSGLGKFRSSSAYQEFQYSLDNENWYDIPYMNNRLYVNTGTEIFIRGKVGSDGNNDGRWNTKFNLSGKWAVKGNIMYLYDYENLNNTEIVYKGAFLGLFDETYQGLYDSHIYDISELILPATVLSQYCYCGMFSGCHYITEAPALPATSLSNSCYARMFYGCTALTEAPALPATSLAVNCYSEMFNGCTALAEAPVLPATTLANWCYNSMFAYCTLLNKLVTYAQDNSARECTTSWLYGVSASGTFVKKAGVTWPTGDSGIPSGWTVQEV